MSFKTLYKSLFVLAFIIAFADYIITNLAFARFPIWFEANIWIRLLFRFVNPYMASTIVFMITLLFLMGSYNLLRGWLNQPPYSSSLRELGVYLWSLSEVRARDRAIFACLALLIVFIIQHGMGFTSWVVTFIRYG